MKLHCAGMVLTGILTMTLAAGPSLAGTAAIVSDRDNTLYEDSSGTTSNGAGQYMFAGVTSQGFIRRGLVRFDVASAVPAGAIITSATLTMNVSTGNFPNDVSINRLLADWGEGASNAPGPEGGGTAAQPGDATWLHMFSGGSFWTNPGGDFDAIASATTNITGLGSFNWSSTSLTADAQLWLDNPTVNYGWALLGNESASGTAVRFDTRENPTAGNRPTLTIQYTAVPTPGALALLGLGTFAKRRRRQRDI